MPTPQQHTCEECNNHSGMEARMSRAERDVQTLFDGIKALQGWVIAGMGSLLLAVIVFVGDVIASHLQVK